MQNTYIKWWAYPWHFLKSKRLAVVLIVLLTLFSTIGMIIPQITPNAGDYQAWAVKYKPLGPVVELLGLNNIFRTRWFAALGIIFFINLFFCTLLQFLQGLKIWRRRLQPVQLEPLTEFAAAGDFETVRDTAVQAFAGVGYKLIGTDNDDLFMEKHRWGIWGSVIFHLGLITIVLAGLLTGAVKTSGYMMVAEGETRREIHDNYDVIYEGPFFPEGSHYGFELTLNKQTKYYDKQGRLDYLKSDLTISENGRPVLDKPLTKGEPLIYKDMRFFEYDDGFAPRISLIKPDGNMVFQTFLLLNTHRNTDRYKYYYNNLQLPDTPYTVSMEFYPDMVNKSSRLNNPAAKVVIREKGKQIAQKVIKQGETIIFDRYKFSFSEVRAWTGLEVVRDPGATVLFGGFWLALAGLVVLYFLRYQKLQLTLINDDQVVKVKVFYYTLRHRKFLSDDTIAAADDLKKKFA